MSVFRKVRQLLHLAAKPYPLDWETRRRVELLFAPKEQELVSKLLEEQCGTNNIPYAIEQTRFAVLKLSDGDLSKFKGAIQVVKRDFRDILDEAGFFEPGQGNWEHWLPNKKW